MGGEFQESWKRSKHKGVKAKKEKNDERQSI